MTPLLVQFGAGNIGRSFIGQLFSRGGYEVAFVDVVDRLVTAMNAQRRYRVIIKHPERDETMMIENVRAIHSGNINAVADAVAQADIAATSVGQRALPFVLPALAQGLLRRRELHGDRPLDIILAENLHGAAAFVRERLRPHLPADYPIDTLVGLIETSIGKMVPIMRAADVEQDPLWVFAEPYNELILDARGFRNPIPAIPGLAPKNNIAAYVDRKLWIHNLGHCTAAYAGFHLHPDATYLYEALADDRVFGAARQAMLQSAAALTAQYPDEFTPADLEAHVDDLLRRFANRALQDTVYRVGRDLYRKLAKHDRLIGAMLLAARHHLPCDAIARAVAMALRFAKRDENGELFPDDQRFIEQDLPQGLHHILGEIAGLSDDNPTEARVIAEIAQAIEAV